MNKSVSYAGIGTRDLLSIDYDRLMYIGKTLAKKGFILHTGAAKGADQAFAEGALQAGGHVVLYLPWFSYECDWVKRQKTAKINVLDDGDIKAFASVVKYHPNIKYLSSGSIKLHARNYRIVKDRNFVIALRRSDCRGGTEQGIRIASDLNIPIFYLNNGPLRFQDIKSIIK